MFVFRAKIAVEAYRETAQSKVDAKANEKAALRQLDRAQETLHGFKKRESKAQALRRENNDLHIQNKTLESERDHAVKK